MSVSFVLEMTSNRKTQIHFQLIVINAGILLNLILAADAKPLLRSMSNRIVLSVSSINSLRNSNKTYWRPNYPSYRRNSFVSTYKRNGNDRLTKLLLIGGKKGNDVFSDSWIYTPWINSWYRVPNGRERLPPVSATGFEVLPSLCSVYVIFIYNAQDVRMFDGRTETWSRVSVESSLPNTSNHDRIFYTGSVLLNESTCEDSRCSCSGSVLFYESVLSIYSQNTLLAIELVCSNRKQINMACHWKKHYYAKLPDFSQFGQIAVSDKSKHESIYFTSRDFSSSMYKMLKTLVVYKLISNKIALFLYNMSGIERTSCDTHSIIAWRNVILLTYDYRSVLAISIKNESQYKWIKLESKQSSEPDAIAWQMIENETSSEIVRFYWKTSKSPVSVSVYYDVNINTTLDSHDIWPSFVEMEKHPPVLSPRSLRYHTSIYDYNSNTFYLYGGIQSGSTLWTLTMPSKTWWLIQPETAPSAYISSCGTIFDSKLIIFGGKYRDGSVGNELWLYETNVRLWNQIQTDKYLWPLARAGCSLTGDSTTSTLYLFGGYSNSEVSLSDAWQLQLKSDGTAVWQQLLSHTVGSDAKLSLAGLGHSALMINDELVIHRSRERQTLIQDCLLDTWILNVSSKWWRQLPTTDDNYKTVFSNKSTAACRNFLLPYGRTKAIAIESRYDHKLMTASSVIQIISVVTGKTTLLSFSSRSIIPLAAGLWNGRLAVYMVGLKEDGLTFTGRNCSSGFAQVNGPDNSPCQRCSIGTYYSNYLGVGECIQCPDGTTTKQPGMTSITSCTCEVGYCRHGTCRISAISGNYFTAVCSCSFGFTGRLCNNLSFFMYMLVTLALFTIIFVTTSLSCCCVRTVRHRRARIQTEKELEETRRAFTIQSQEIELVSRLDEDCPGGYGQVHKATYRDWTVAVKQLQLVMAEWADVRRDFLREIKFMQTVRHPNIVMFMGAGQYNVNNPFLVLEFMGGGALWSLLHESDVQLSTKEQLNFVLDAAKGMNYLHTLKPPRIHRDLKSANLLLSLNWQVKVADFGSARLIPQLKEALVTEDKDKRKQKAIKNNDEIDFKHLLDERFDLTSRYIGTARWRSPEVWKRTAYGTPTDVYSFAIVVWEILTRETPFCDANYKFDADVEFAVLNGIRPPIPNYTSEFFRNLIEQCWQHESQARPSFQCIVSQLESARNSQFFGITKST